MALNVFIPQLFSSAISTNFLQNVTAFCALQPAAWSLLGTFPCCISDGCACVLNRSEGQESSKVATVGSTLLIPVTLWIVSIESAVEIPCHSSRSTLPGVRGVQLCHAVFEKCRLSCHGL